MSSSSVSFTRENIHDNEPSEDTHDGSTEESESESSEDEMPKRPALSRAATLAEEDESFQAIADTLQSWAKKRPTEKPYEWDITPEASDVEKTSESDSDSSVMRKTVRFSDKSHSVEKKVEVATEPPPKPPISLQRAATGYFFDHADSEAASETVSNTRKAKLEYLQRADSNLSDKTDTSPRKPMPAVAARKGAFLNKLAAFQSKNDPPLVPTGIVPKTTIIFKASTPVPSFVSNEPEKIQKTSKLTKQQPAEFITPLHSKPKQIQTAPKALAESYYDNVSSIEEREKEVTENLEQPTDNSYRPSKLQSSAFANARKMFNQTATKDGSESLKQAPTMRPKKIIKVNTQAFEKH